MIKKNYHVWLMIMSGLIITLSGCGGVIKHSVDFDKGYTPSAGAKIEVLKVTNVTGLQFDFDIESTLKSNLIQVLQKNDLLFSPNDKNKLSASCKILEYTKGDTFKRWLWPGYGEAVLAVECSLSDADKSVGKIQAKHSFSSGGLLSGHAGQTVILRLAEDVVGDLEEKLKPQP